MPITIDIKADKLLKDLSNDLVDEEGLIRELTLKSEGYCRSEAPKDTGALARGITSRISGSTGEVKAGEEYWKDVVFGTSPHEIRVKNKKVLSDRNSGSTHKKDAIYGTRVMHPGTKPNNFPARAVNKVRGEIPGIAQKYVRLKQ